MHEMYDDRNETAVTPTDASLTKDEPQGIAPSVKTEEKEEVYITGIKLYLVLLGITLVGFLVMLDQTIMITAIPQISVRFNSLKDIGWYGSAYLLTTSSTQPLTGKIYQYYPSKIVFLACLSAFEIGSLICGVAQSSKMLIVGRAIAGIGGGGLFTGMITIIAACAPVAKRPAYLGATMGVASIGLVCGPILGGVFTEYSSWRWCFFINLPLGAVTLVILSFIRIPGSHVQNDTKATPKEQIKRLDLLGYISFTPAIVMLLLAIQWGGATYAWDSAVIIGLFCGFGGALPVFLWIEKRAGEDAMLPLKIISQPKVICIMVMSSLSAGCGLLVAYYLPIWFQVIQNVSPTMGGIHLLPTIGSMAFGSALSGGLVTRTGYFTPFAILGGALSAIGAGLLTILTPNSDAAMWAGFQVFAGLGRGVAIQQGITAIQVALPPAMLPVGSAIVMFVQLLGGTLFISFGQTIFTNQLKTAIPHFAPEVDSSKILEVGATAFKTVVTPSQIPGVVLAYNQALTRIYYLSAAGGCIAFLVSFGIGWTNIKTKESPESVDEKV